MTLSKNIEVLAKASAFNVYEGGTKGKETRSLSFYPDYAQPMKVRPTQYAKFYGVNADKSAEDFLKSYVRKPWRHE